MTRPRGRPRSENPKVPVTLRLHASELARWQALGENWRARMEATLKEGPTGAVMAVRQSIQGTNAVAAPSAPRAVGSVKVETGKLRMPKAEMGSRLKKSKP